MRNCRFLFLSILIFTFGCCSLYAKPMSQISKNIKLGFGPASERAIGLDDEFIKYVDSAKKTLHGCFYEFRLDSIVDAFIRAKKRGVDVKLVVDNNNYFLPPDPVTEDEEREIVPQKISRNSSALNPFVARLKKAGVKVREDNNRSSLMHNKFAIKDGKHVWTGSFNLTNTCSFKNPNNAIQIASVELAKVFEKEFYEMFSKRMFGPSSPKHKKNVSVNVDGTKIEVYFAPEDDPNAKVKELIKNAAEEVCFMQFAFTADELRNELIRKFKSGIKVHGIFDRLLYRSTGPYGEFSYLTEAGIPVRIHSGTGKFHHKVFIVDPNGENPAVVLGSENASTNGNKSNDENILIVRSKKIAKAFHKEFLSRLGEYSEATAYMQIGDIPFAKENIQLGDLHVFSNGRNISKIRVDYPARWPVMIANGGGVSVFRDRKNTSKKEKMSFSARGFTLHSANLKANGKNSKLLLTFRNIMAPEIPGKYAIPISVSYSESPNKFISIRSHPTVWVFDPDSSEDFQRLLDYLTRLHATLDELKGNLNKNQRQEQERNVYFMVKKVIGHLSKKVAEGDYDERIEHAINYFKSLSPKWRSYLMLASNRLLGLRNVLTYRAIHHKAEDKNAGNYLREIENMIIESER